MTTFFCFDLRYQSIMLFLFPIITTSVLQKSFSEKSYFRVRIKHYLIHILEFQTGKALVAHILQRPYCFQQYLFQQKSSIIIFGRVLNTSHWGIYLTYLLGTVLTDQKSTFHLVYQDDPMEILNEFRWHDFFHIDIIFL